MIIEFSVENFLSFKKRETFSMVASSDDSLVSNVTEENGIRLLKTTAIYGANASGKSNLFKILSNISVMLQMSNNFNPDTILPIVPFKLDFESINKASSFEIKFIKQGIKYVYGFTANSQNIYQEYLYYYPNGRIAKIFERDDINNYEFSQDKKILQNISEKNMANKFFLATATSWNYDKTKPAYDFLTLDLGVIIDVNSISNFAFDLYAKAEDKKLMNFALEFMNKTDISINDFILQERKMSESERIGLLEQYRVLLPKDIVGYQVITKHLIDKVEYLFDISEESLGTQMIFVMIPFLQLALEKGRVLMVDELDRSLHPSLVQMLIETFNDDNINSHGAQLIFNTHDTNLLNLKILRRDQIWFTEKNHQDGISVIYPLDDFKVRNKDNIEKGYLLGRYGAIPFIQSVTNIWEEIAEK